MQCLWLVKNGVPFDVAFSVDEDTLKGWTVLFGKFEGGEFDWDADRWRERS